MSFHRQLGLLLLLVATSKLVGEPIAINDRSSFSRLQGLPVPLDARLVAAGETKQSIQYEWTSQFALDETRNGATLIDGETQELHGYFRRGVADRFEMTVDIPIISQSGGSLDSFVENWHQWFGLPNGGREQFAQDQLRYSIVTDDFVFDYREPSTGLGDIGVGIRYQWYNSTDSALSSSIRLELPTGDIDKMTGSDSLDVAAGVEYSNSAWLRRFRTDLYASAGFVWFGDSEVLAQKSEATAWYGHISTATRVWFDWRLRLQLQSHSTMFDLPTTPFERPALQGALSLQMPITKSYHLELGMTEDLITKVTPDFTWLVAVKWQP